MKNNPNIKVIGIDPAPSKDSTIFDGDNFSQENYSGLQGYLERVKSNYEKVLICWDAPLTFPKLLDEKPKKYSPLYFRPIEYFFNKLKGQYKLPKGISVQGYAECPHWAVTQYILGYPSLKEDKKNQPYELVFDNSKISKSVIEVHPALAMWIWAMPNVVEFSGYKDGGEKTESVINELIKKGVLNEDIKSKIMKQYKKYQADSLDAYIAWKLGNEWANGNGDVSILGDEITGSFLLPYNKDIFEMFNNFQVK